MVPVGLRVVSPMPRVYLAPDPSVIFPEIVNVGLLVAAVVITATVPKPIKKSFTESGPAAKVCVLPPTVGWM